MTQHWNLNIHYQRLVLDAVPAHATTAIDVGSGDGLLAVDLAARGLAVTALDMHRPSVERARANLADSTDATVIEADLLATDLPAGSFDVVASVAMLHHIDAVDGLRALRRLVAPSGVVVVVGFAQIRRPSDYLRAAVGRIVKLAKRLRGQRNWHHNAPIAWPPPLDFAQMRELAQTELPGCEFRPLLSSRYAITWQAPPSQG